MPSLPRQLRRHSTPCQISNPARVVSTLVWLVVLIWLVVELGSIGDYLATRQFSLWASSDILRVLVQSIGWLEQDYDSLGGSRIGTGAIDRSEGARVGAFDGAGANNS